MSDPTLSLHRLSEDAAELLDSMAVHPHLLAHLILVHDAAVRLVEGIQKTWPDVAFDEKAVIFGAATHDVGKILHPEEMTGPGEAHRAAGVELLRSQGVEPARARFARTHATWQAEAVQLEDLLVALADNVWAGRRDRELEDAIVREISASDESAIWNTFMALDDLLTEIATDAELRLVWQSQFLKSEGN